MQTWSYFIAVFSFLLSWQDSKNETPSRLWKREAGFYFREGIALAILSVLNVFIARAFQSVFANADFQMPLIWLVSYLCASVGKKSNIYFLALFAFSYYSAEYESGLSLIQAGTRVFLAGVLTGAFHLLLTGTKKRILFSPIPKSASGLPFLIMIAAVLSLCLSGIARAMSLMF